jgi:hypothetical protein
MHKALIINAGIRPLSPKRNNKQVEKKQWRSKFYNMCKKTNFDTIESTTKKTKENTSYMKSKTSISRTIVAAGLIPLLVVTLAANSRAGLADPVGISQVTVPASTTSVLGTPYARPVEAFGTVTSAATSGSNTVLTVTKDASSVSFPSFTNADENVDAWYIVEIQDGPAIGLIMDAVGGAGDTSITVKGVLPSSISIASGSRFAVRKAWTLASLFGAASATNPFGSGLTSTAAGVNAQVQLLNPTTGGLTTYYINVIGGVYNWRASSGSANKNHVSLGLGKGFVVVNRKATQFAFNASGDFRTARTRLVVPANGAKTLLANPSVFNTTFTAATIPATSPTRGTSVPSTADQYALWNTSTRAFTTYKIGGTANAAGPSAYSGSTRVNPAIDKFTSVLVTPAGTTDTVVTIAPAYNP